MVSWRKCPEESRHGLHGYWPGCYTLLKFVRRENHADVWEVKPEFDSALKLPLEPNRLRAGNPQRRLEARVYDFKRLDGPLLRSRRRNMGRALKHALCVDHFMMPGGFRTLHVIIYAPSATGPDKDSPVAPKTSRTIRKTGKTERQRRRRIRKRQYSRDEKVGSGVQNGELSALSSARGAVGYPTGDVKKSSTPQGTRQKPTRDNRIFAWLAFVLQKYYSCEEPYLSKSIPPCSPTIRQMLEEIYARYSDSKLTESARGYFDCSLLILPLNNLYHAKLLENAKHVQRDVRFLLELIATFGDARRRDGHSSHARLLDPSKLRNLRCLKQVYFQKFDAGIQVLFSWLKVACESEACLQNLISKLKETDT